MAERHFISCILPLVIILESPTNNILKVMVPYDLTYMRNLMNKIEPEAWRHETDRQISEGREVWGTGWKKVKREN